MLLSAIPAVMCYSYRMTPAFWAILLKPFFLLGFLTALLLVRYLVKWFMPECRLKRLLLLRVD